LLLGEASGGLIDVDLDSSTCRALAGAFLPATGLKSGRESSRKSHWWYVCEGMETTKFKAPAGAMLVEIRSSGCQTVVHPSIHPSGEQYIWEDDEQPAIVKPSVLLHCVQMLAAATLLGSKWPQQGSRHDVAMAVAGMLLKGGYSLDETRRIIEAAAYVGGDPELKNRMDAVGDTWEKVQANVPYTAYKTARRLLGNEPAERVATWLGLSFAPDADKDKPLLEIITSKEMDDGNFDLEFLIEDCLVARQPCLMGGQQKTLKTNCLVDLGVSLAIGEGQFLNRFDVHRAAPTVIFSGESGLSTLQETGRRVAESKGYNLKDLDLLFWSVTLPRIGLQPHVDAMVEVIEARDIEVIIIDPAYLSLIDAASDMGNLFSVGELLRKLSIKLQQLGCTLILAHHVKKNRASERHDAPQLEEIAWSGFAEFARQWLLLGRRKPYEEGTGRHELWLRVGGSAGHSGLWELDIEEGQNDASTGRDWEVVCNAHTREPADEEPEDFTTLQRHKWQIIDAMKEFPEGETKRKIRDRSGLNSKYFDAAFAELIEEAIAVPITITRVNGQEYSGFELCLDEAE
jgi:hypothetical protein